MSGTEDKKYEGGYWPLEDDTLLLKTILLPRQQAIKAWEEWLQVVNIDTLEAGSQRMFPLLYIKLKEYNIDHPLMDKFKGIYRQTWYKNQMMFHHIAPLIKAFKDESIESMVLKGAALTTLYYKDLGLRHMSDFDLMVSTSDVTKSLKILRSHGYEPIQRTWESFNDNLLYFRHSWGFIHVNTKQELDLHWHLLLENCALNDDDNLWKHSQSIKINDIVINTLDATDHLMHTCVHGLKWNELSSIRWAADAAIIIDQKKIDWKRLVEEAKKRHIVLQVLNAFSFLHDKLSVPIPKEILNNLSTYELNKIEYYGDTINKYTNNEFSIVERLHIYRYRYLRYCQALPGNKLSFMNPGVFLDFTKAILMVDSTIQIPMAFVNKVATIIKRRQVAHKLKS